MKVLIYENSSGFAHYTYKLCNALVNDSNTNEVFYLTDKVNNYISSLDERVKVTNDLKVPTKIKGKRLLWAINRTYVAVCNILIRNRMIKKGSFDVLNIQTTLSVIEQFFIKSVGNKVKVVLTVHDVIPPIKSLYWSEKSLKKVYENAHLLIVHSKNNKDELVNRFGIGQDKIRVIHHGVDVHYNKCEQDLCREKLGIPNDKVVSFLFFGLIREQKGLDILIEAIERIDTPCRLIIAGGMPNGENFEKYEKLMIKKDRFVKRIDYIPEEDLQYYFQVVDAVVFPYKYFYSQSGVFMQCVKYRTPIIATDVSSFRQYIEDYGIGLVAEPNDVESMCLTLEMFIKMEAVEKEKLIQNLESAAYDNSWEKAASLHNKCFKEIGNAKC